MSIEPIINDIKAKLSKTSPIGSTVKFMFEDETSLYLDGSDECNTITDDNKPAECTIKLKKKDFENMVTGKLSPMTAFMTGKLRVEGNMGVAMKLTSIFS